MAKKDEPTAYEVLWDIVDNLKCYKTFQKDFLVELNVNKRWEIVNIKSDDFKNWAIRTLDNDGYLIETEGLNHIISRLAGKIWGIDKGIEINTRMASSSNAIYYDLCNKGGEIVKITTNGYSIITTRNCHQKFIRDNNLREQFKPLNDKEIDLSELKKYFNIKSEKDFELLLVYIVSCFIPNISHPIFILSGSHGAAKTTVNRLIKKIVDPSYADTLSMPEGKRDLIVQLSKGYMLFFDNIRKISDEYNDILCQVSTGGYQLARKLYSDNDIVAYKLQRCLMLNGISKLTDQPDLLDRSIAVRFERITDIDRMTESDLYSNFNHDLPYFLNSIFNIISKAMARHKTVKLKRLPRMADFAQWGYAIAEVMGIGGDNFLKSYRENQLGITLELLQDNPTAIAIIDFMKGKTEWKGSVRNLWQELDKFATSTSINKNDTLWARNENSLGKRLEELKISLEGQGVHFDKRNVGTCKEVTLINQNPPTLQGKPKKKQN